MDKTKSSLWIAIASALCSLFTLYFAYLKPLWFDSSKFEFQPNKYLTITEYFGEISLQKPFSIINTGKLEALITKVECFLIDEKTYNTHCYDDVYYVYDPGYLTNDEKTRYKLLNGFTIWSQNGYENDFYYVQHHDQYYATVYQDIKDSLQSEIKSFKNKSNPWRNSIDSFEVPDILKTKIIEAQSSIDQILSPGTFFICERLITSEGKRLYQVYSFQISATNVSFLKKLTTEIINRRNIQLSQSITVDLKNASQEEKARIVNKVNEYDRKFNE